MTEEVEERRRKERGEETAHRTVARTDEGVRRVTHDITPITLASLYRRSQLPRCRAAAPHNVIRSHICGDDGAACAKTSV